MIAIVVRDPIGKPVLIAPTGPARLPRTPSAITLIGAPEGDL